MKQRGRPKTIDKPATITRSLMFPADLYAQVKQIATAEERDVTSQIVKVLRDFVTQHERRAA
jgi:hypothetical protein